MTRTFQSQPQLGCLASVLLLALTYLSKLSTVLHAQKLVVAVRGRFVKCLVPLETLCFVMQKSKDLSKFTSPTQVIAFDHLPFEVVRHRSHRHPFHRRTPRRSILGTTVAIMW